MLQEKPIILHGLISKYLIVENGDVIKVNVTDGKRKYMKHQIDKNGYHVVVLHLHGKTIFRRISRLVAEAFIPNPENKPEVNHKDGNKDNNNISNLEWVTTKENIHHAWANNLTHAREGENHPNSVYTEDQIREVCQHIQDNDMFMSDIAELTGVTYTVVKQIRNKVIWNSISDEYDFSKYNMNARNRKRKK